MGLDELIDELKRSERKVIFDGGSQNSLKYTKLEDLNSMDGGIEKKKGCLNLSSTMILVHWFLNHLMGLE